MSEDGARFDARFDDGGPFRDTPGTGGISLESALNDYGPAAIEDLIPRVRALAKTLDAAHRRGVVHGAIHPSKVFVTGDATVLVKGAMSSAPYIAPEVAEGDAPTPASDLFSLAAVTYEWMFGRRIDGPAYRTVDVKPLPGVDRTTLAKAFSRALAPAPEVRFASCAEFCDALAAATSAELPLLAFDEEDDDSDPVRPFIPEVADAPAPGVEDVKIAAEEANVTTGPFDLDGEAELRAQDRPFDSDRDDAVFAQDRPPDLDIIAPVPLDEGRGAALLDRDQPIEPAPVPSWNPSTPPPSQSQQRFGGVALILAVLVGSLFGFAAGYMAKPRALQGGAPQEFATDRGAQSAQGAQGAQGEQGARSAPPTPTTESAPAPASSAPAPSAPVVGRLLIRSTPAGATVSVDGVEKGSTPLALRDVEYGTHTVMVTRSGYVAESRRVALSASRPSRTLDVALSAVAQPPATKRSAPPRPSTPATLGRPAVTTGSLNVDSRPAGAAVSINGKPSGVTPLTVNDLPPGEYRIQLSMPGYRNFAATVRVVAGERARAAYSLTAQEQE